MKKIAILIFLFLLSFKSFSQFSEEVSKIQLYDMASDIKVFGQMIVKDKIYLINNLLKEDSSQEFDYAMSKIEENISNIDLAEDNPKIKARLKAIKAFWYKATENVTRKMDNLDFRKVSFDANNWNRLTSDLLETMKVEYDLSNDDLKTYNDIQDFRVLIQKITTSFLADNLKLSKSFIHEYQKNIKLAKDFVMKKSNLLLNNKTIPSELVLEVIVDWDFMRANLTSKTHRNPKTIFMLSVGMDYHLSQMKNKFLKKFIDKF